MKDDFRNRIDTQREILEIVNLYQWKEELFGLSEKAINRWMVINNIPNDLVDVIKNIGSKLFFLGVRSQEQITNEYLDLSYDITMDIKKLMGMLREKYH